MEPLNKKLLVTLLDFAQSDQRATVDSLARSLTRSRREVAGGLNELAVRGLVCADTVRLTLLGVMRAAGLRARCADVSLGARSDRGAAA